MIDVPWNAPREEIAPEVGARLGRAWRYRMWNEAGAGAAFLRLADLAAQSGAPGSLIEEMRASAEDEARHAETCRRMIARFTGEADPKGPPPFPELPLGDASGPEEAALRGVVLMSCISETIGCAFQREIAETAADPAVRAAQEIFYAEELRHGRFGWAYLAFEAKRAPDRVRRLAEIVPRLIDAYAAGLAETSEGDTRGLELERYGILGVHHTQRLFRDALERLVIPGFEEFGMDLASVRNAYPVIA